MPGWAHDRRRRRTRRRTRRRPGPSGRPRAPPLSGRRLGLHLPRLPRAAAADPRRTARRSTRCSASATCCGSCCTTWAATAATTRPTSPSSSTPAASPSATTSTTSTRRTGPTAARDLVPQFALIREATRAFDVPAIELAGFEADDLIATYAAQARAGGGRVTIVSSDKDLMQLVAAGVEHARPDQEPADRRAPRWWRSSACRPTRSSTCRRCAGDSVDNVPGVPGIGIKTAAAADQRVRRPRDAAGPRGRDQAAQAPRDADRERREGAHLARAGAPARRRAAAGADRRPRRAAARAGDAAAPS